MNLIRIKAFPDSKKAALEVVAPDRLRIFVREPAQDNQANNAVLKVVAEHLGIEVKKLRMISGHRGPNKIIEIRT